MVVSGPFKVSPTLLLLLLGLMQMLGLPLLVLLLQCPARL